MTHKPIAPIRKQIMVEAPQERAFRVFTEKFDTWWPREHHIGKAEMQAAVMELKAGGRMYEKGVDGSECEWGKVLVFEPPRRVVFTWQLTTQWQYDADFVTEVEITFSAEGPQRTRVELEHRALDRYGDAAQTMRDMLDRGWGRTLELYAASAQR
jgi:uncharacterized protein YndB with AHSA1/START domain